MTRSALKSLSDRELLVQIDKLRRREHLSTLDILLHLNEVDRSKLHLTLAYSSLYDYCVKHLRYSASGAGRRVAVARCIKYHPEVLDLLRSGKLNVTGVALVASVLREDNKAELLASIQNKTQSEIDAIAARYRRPIAFKDRVKPVRVFVPEPRTRARDVDSGTHSPAPNGACEKSNYSHNGSGLVLTGCNNKGNGSSNGRHGHTEQKLLIQFLANKEFMKKYEEVRALLSQRLSDTSFENVFEALIEEFIERHSPARRKARRDTRKTTNRPTPRKPRQAAASNEAKPERPTVASRHANSKRNSRHIPAAVRDEVFARDKGCCTYIGKTGKRCGSIQALQIDHIKPFTRGGADTASNLRLLCAKHNRLAAEEVLGEATLRRYQPRE